MKFDVLTYGDPGADILLIQMTDDHDLEFIDREAAYIRELTGGKSFCLKAVRVEDWNRDLSPWPAPAVFGNEAFGDGAEETLRFVLEEVLPDAVAGLPGASGVPSDASAAVSNAAAASAPAPKIIYLGGYSLAGLFALWAGYQTDRFDGIAAASPSIWFPSFIGYMKENPIHAESVYLSLGDREERTRNPVMAQVGNAIRAGYEILTNNGIVCILEWNKGNHFKQPDLRTAKAFAWLMNRGRSEEAGCNS